MSQSINGMLDDLADMKDGLDVLRLRMEDMQATIITDEQRMAIKDIEIEFEPQFETLAEGIDDLQKAIKVAVLDAGRTIKSSRMQAVWSKPRVRWDARALDGYAMNHPELFAFRNEGNASVSFRAVKQ